jgi:hypothetical protein
MRPTSRVVAWAVVVFTIASASGLSPSGTVAVQDAPERDRSGRDAA